MAKRLPRSRKRWVDRQKGGSAPFLFVPPSVADQVGCRTSHDTFPFLCFARGRKLVHAEVAPRCAALEFILQCSSAACCPGRNRSAGPGRKRPPRWRRDFAAVIAIDLARASCGTPFSRLTRKTCELSLASDACESAPVEQVGMAGRPDLAIGIQAELFRRRGQGQRIRFVQSAAKDIAVEGFDAAGGQARHQKMVPSGSTRPRAP